MSAESKIPALKKTEKPTRRGSRKLLSLIIVFFIIIFIILFFQSSLSKISTIEVIGNELTTAEQIGQTSKVTVGQQYFSIRSKSVEDKVKSLKTIETVQVTKTFPGKIRIEVKEFGRAAYQIGSNGTPEVLLADGISYPLQDSSFPIDRPLMTGWTDDNPMKAKLCQVLAAIPAPLLSDVSEIKPSPSIYEDKIKLYTRSQFEVITRISLLSEKIQYLSYFTSEFKEKNGTTGILTLLDTDRGVPFDKSQKPGDVKDTDGKKR